MNCYKNYSYDNNITRNFLNFNQLKLLFYINITDISFTFVILLLLSLFN